MARHKLENELIAIEVEEHGAELKSLVRKNTGKKNICGKLIQKILGTHLTGTVSVCWSGKKTNSFVPKDRLTPWDSTDLPAIWILRWILRRRIRSGLY